MIAGIFLLMKNGNARKKKYHNNILNKYKLAKYKINIPVNFFLKNLINFSFHVIFF